MKKTLPKKIKTIPNPGSDDAIDLGCTCPVMDNGHGKGSYWGPNTFIYSGSCKLHNEVLARARSNSTK